MGITTQPELGDGVAPEPEDIPAHRGLAQAEIVGDFPYVYPDGVILKRNWAGEVRNVSVLIAIGVGIDGFRQILGVVEGEKEDLEWWRGFLCHLKDRGLKGVRLIISDACRGLVEASAEVVMRVAVELVQFSLR